MTAIELIIVMIAIFPIASRTGSGMDAKGMFNQTSGFKKNGTDRVPDKSNSSEDG